MFMIKAILFDLFGTLVDNPTNAQVSQLHSEAAAVLGLPADAYAKGWKATFYERARGDHGSVAQSIAAAVRHGGYPVDEEALPRAVEIRYTHTRNWLVPRSDAFQ